MTGIKIFFACFTGAVIGSLVALQFSPFFWWLGLIIGGGTGYITYEFNRVLNAIKTAWKEVYPKISNKKLWKWVGYQLLAQISLYLTYCTINSIFSSISKGKIEIVNFPFFWVPLFLLLLFLSLAVIAVISKDATSFKENDRKLLKAMILHGNPVAVLIYWPIRGLYMFVFKTPWKKVFLFFVRIPLNLLKWTTKVFWKFCLFLKKVFILIHSDIRLLCGIDAAIGSGCGYLLGNVLIGGLIGGILGVLNYYFVSIKILKLNLSPQK